MILFDVSLFKDPTGRFPLLLQLIGPVPLLTLSLLNSEEPPPTGLSLSHSIVPSALLPSVPLVIFLPPSLYFDFLLPLFTSYTSICLYLSFRETLEHYSGEDPFLCLDQINSCHFRDLGSPKKQILKEVLIVLFLLSTQDDVK
jgi:hypothetical protein